MNRWQSLAVLVVTTCLSLVAAMRTDWSVLSPAVSRNESTPISMPLAPVEIGRHARGSVDTARVAVVEFADFQCPFCKQFANAVQPQLTKEYVDSGRVIWSFRHLPLTSIHPHARAAADLSECLGRQGDFWHAHDALFANWHGTELTPVNLPALFESPSSSLQSCLGRTQSNVDGDLRDALALGITVTPTFLMGPIRNGQVIVEEIVIGSTTLEEFRRMLDGRLGSPNRAPRNR